MRQHERSTRPWKRQCLLHFIEDDMVSLFCFAASASLAPSSLRPAITCGATKEKRCISQYEDVCHRPHADPSLCGSFHILKQMHRLICCATSPSAASGMGAGRCLHIYVYTSYYIMEWRRRDIAGAKGHTTPIQKTPIPQAYMCRHRPMVIQTFKPVT